MNLNLTMFGQVISFGIFVWFCWKFVWPPIIKGLTERQQKIADGLAAAERGEHEQELAEKHAKEVLKQAKDQAAEIISQAQKRSNQLVEEAKTTARTEGERIKVAAQSDIEQEVGRAKEVLRKEVASIALLGAERILQKELNAATHKDVLDSLAAKI